MTAVKQVPRLSLQGFHNPATQADFVTALWQALSEFGFVVICDHGISAQQFARAYELSQQLFSLPLTTKQRYEAGHGQRGYISFGKEYAKDNPHPDLKEYWHIGPDISPGSPYWNEYPKNIWPEDSLPAFKAFFQQLHQQLNSVAETLLQAIALAAHLPENYFSELIADGNTVQRLIHYPPLAGLQAGQSVRAAAHADINLMTLLIGATESGLELLNRDGSWLPVANQENDLVVDTGDMMALLTNNALPATVHRVVNPEDPTKPRYSIPFFVHPHNRALLSPLPEFVGEEQAAQFAPITAGDYLAQRLRENGF